MTSWDRPEVVAGFVASPPNEVLMAWVRSRSQGRALTVVDIGGGAGRNAVPLALAGHRVIALDRSVAMIEAARRRAAAQGVAPSLEATVAPMDQLPVPDACADIVIAHGIWNLASSDAELKRALGEAARVARPGAGLFVFTFSRDTLAADLTPLAGETHVFTRFSGEAQVFLTQGELEELLGDVGFERETPGPLTRYNFRGKLPAGTTTSRPVLWEGTWIRRASSALVSP